MAWVDLDLASGWWTVPAERAKNKLAHRVPLSSPAMRVLQELGARRVGDSPWVFPSESGTGYSEDVHRAVASIRECSGVEDFRPHDIRRTVATFLTSELGVSRPVAEVLRPRDPSRRDRDGTEAPYPPAFSGGMRRGRAEGAGLRGRHGGLPAAPRCAGAASSTPRRRRCSPPSASRASATRRR